MFTDLNVASNVPSYTTGSDESHWSMELNPISFAYRWEAKSYTKATFYVPDNWKSGRIWVCLLDIILFCIQYSDPFLICPLRVAEIATLVRIQAQTHALLVGAMVA